METMNTSVVQASPSTALLTRFQQLNGAQRTRLFAGVMMLFLVGVLGVFLSRQPDWRPLYANLGDKDGGAVIAQLAQLNVPYKHADPGGLIMVPADKVHDTRLRLASMGLPKGSVAGFDQLETNRFGMTQFQERLAFQRGLEGELARSIQSIASVQSARVHLAIPNQNGFYREQQKPTASVLLSLYSGRALEKAQVAGIVHLVSSSVAEMNPKAVSVIDEAGNLLSGSTDIGGIDGQQLQYLQQVEKTLSQRIVGILEPIVGAGNVRAQVSAEVDFSQSESTSEQHKPNLSAEASAVRSQQVLETAASTGGSGVAGVPGATSNQPPASASAPVNGSASATSVTNQPGVKRELVTNYEVDKTVKTFRSVPGSIKRLSAAVLVNYKSSSEGDGKSVAKPISDQQLEQMGNLVREAMGFSKERGDSMNLMNAPFKSETIKSVELPWWQQEGLLNLARNLAWPLVMVAFTLAVILGVIRPALMKTARDLQPSQGRLDAVIAEVPDRPRLLTSEASVSSSTDPALPSAEQLRLEEARVLAKQNPVAVANIVKTWVNGEAAT